MIQNHSIQPRFFDIDANNHVNNSVYFTYMEEARTKLLMKQYLMCKEKGIHFVVVEANCKYKRPIKLQDKVTIEMTVEAMKPATFDISFTFKNSEGTVFALGTTQMACFDEANQRPVRIPSDVVETLTANTCT